MLVLLAAVALPARAATRIPPIKHVFVISLSDQGYNQTFGHTGNDPYLAKTLAAQGELLTNYYAVAGGSLANEIDPPVPYFTVLPGPADATRLGLAPGQRVRLRSRRGMVEGVPVRVTATVREGEVFMPFHYDEMCVNRLTVDEFDPVSREPNYKQCAVRLARCR